MRFQCEILLPLPHLSLPGLRISRMGLGHSSGLRLAVAVDTRDDNHPPDACPDGAFQAGFHQLRMAREVGVGQPDAVKDRIAPRDSSFGCVQIREIGSPHIGPTECSFQLSFIPAGDRERNLPPEKFLRGIPTHSARRAQDRNFRGHVWMSHCSFLAGSERTSV
jgi:hypothetical protein